MPHYNGHGNGHQSDDGRNKHDDHDGRHSLPQKASFGNNGSIPEGYDPSDSDYNPVAIGIVLLGGLLGCGFIALVLLFFQ